MAVLSLVEEGMTFKEAAPEKGTVETGEGETRGKNKKSQKLHFCFYAMPSCYLLSNDLEEVDIKLWNKRIPTGMWRKEGFLSSFYC